MSKRDQITARAKQLVSSKRDGLRFSQLVAALKKAFPGEANGNFTGSIWNLDTRFPEEVYKPRRGVFRSTKYRSKEEVQADLAAQEESTVTIADFVSTLKDLRSRFPHLKRDDLFVLWFLVAHLIDDEDQAANALVGGAGDKGIDAVWTDESAKAVFIVQAKFRETLGQTAENRNDVLGLLDVARHLSQTDDQKFRTYLDKMEPLVAARLPDVRRHLLDESFRLLLYYVTLGRVSNTIRNDTKLSLNDLSRLVSMEIIDATSASTVMRNYLDGVAPSIPACTLEVERGDEVRVNNISQRYDEQNKIECWVLSMRGDKIADLFRTAGTRLFASGTEREKRTHPERLKRTHLGVQDGRFGQERQFGFHSDFRFFLAFIDSRKR